MWECATLLGAPVRTGGVPRHYFMQDLEKKEQEFLEAYDEYARAVYRHVRLRVGRLEDAEDIAAQTFMKTWEYLSLGKHILRMKPFLFRVANNLIIDWYRAKGSQPLPLEEIENENEDREMEDKKFEAAIDARGDVQALERALLELEPSYRDVLVLKYVEGYEVKEIAKKLGVSENVVYVRVHRGRKKITEIMKLSTYEEPVATT